MKKTRVIALLLALCMCLGLLAACNDTTQQNGPVGDRVDGSWDGVDFGGQRVRFCISVNQYEECTFPAADIYTKGPDKAGSNEVAKEVLARNKKATDELGITIEYSTRNLRYSQILDDIRNTVQTSSKNSPDIYNNDMLGLGQAMINGLLWNVKNPGDDVKNYFDFEAEGWYHEFMKGCTFDQNKFYQVAGDYFIDMIRMAWVILVNHDVLKENLGKMPAWCSSVDTFYQFIMDGFWDMDMLADLSGRVFVESSDGTYGVSEPTDTLLGFAANHVTNWVLASASDITLFYQDRDNGYEPKMLESIDDYIKVSNKYMSLIETPGVYVGPATVQDVKASTEYFMNGNVLFAASRLGEMESSALRDFGDEKGLVPFPKWEDDMQDEYHTVIHNQVELASILNTAQAFSASSALLQFLNEESEKVVYAYYEKGLKYKYNDDKNAREMMDLVRETSDSPFGFETGELCIDFYTGQPALKKIYLKDNATLSSTFASEKDVYAACLREMIEKFAKMD